MQAIPGTAQLNLEHKIRLIENKTAPLVYLVHGRAGNYDVMWTFSRLIGEGCNIIAPQAPLQETVIESNVTGYSWWKLNEVGNKLDEVRKSATTLRQFFSEAESAYRLAPSRRIALGFSQGAALLSLLIQEEPGLLNAVGLLAGFVIESPQIPEGNLPEVFMAHGTKDEIVSIELNKKGADFLISCGFKLDYHTEEISHKVGVKSMRELGEWLKRFI